MKLLDISKKSTKLWVVSVANEKRQGIIQILRNKRCVDSVDIYPNERTAFSIVFSALAEEHDRDDIEKLIKDAVA